MKKTSSDTVPTVFYILQMRKLKANKYELFVQVPSGTTKNDAFCLTAAHDSDSMLWLRFCFIF